MEIELKNARSMGEILAVENGQTLGRLTYYLKNEGATMAVNFVVVAKDEQGQGIGTLLMEESIKIAEKNNYKIFPECKFAQVYFEENKNKHSNILE